MADFVHLHNHTHYSLQDAICKVDTLIQATVENKMTAVALTDHGVLYGVPEFYSAAKYAGIKPIVGMEAYITLDGTRFEKGSANSGGTIRRKKPYQHLILIAKNNIGYKNLIKLSSLGYLEGFYYRPRIDMELLKKYHEGLICTTACIGGIVSSHLVNGDYAKAKQVSIDFKELFNDDFYLEIQDHGQDEDKYVLEGVPKLSKELGIKMVATNDIHYIKKDDSIPHNVLLLFADKSGEANYNNLRYKTDQLYFKSEEEMKKLFGKYKGAIENTVEIAEKVDLKIETGTYHFPVFPIPDDSVAKNLDDYFELLSVEGFKKRYNNSNSPDLKSRFDFEIETIKTMGFSGYFLVVQDFINEAKRMGIYVGPGRGSAAGSMVAYCLGITNIEPIEYGLLFERFLNPARKSMPDIDVDFADDRRAEVIDYVKQKYGSASVCQIITFNRLSSKAVLRDVARVLKIPIPSVNNITKLIPSKYGKVYTIQQALEGEAGKNGQDDIKPVPELKWLKDSKDEVMLELLKFGMTLEGMNRNAGKHAAGVVIAPGDVSDFVPLAIPNVSQGDVVTQFNMKDLEKFGLLKMDFLGLRTLTIIRLTLDLIRENRPESEWIADIDLIPLDDEETYQIFCKGQTTAIFQFESGPMREHLKNLKPSSIKDLAAMNALYRPGPMEFIGDFIDRKFERQKTEYLHPILEPILTETYGIIVYQEQVIQIANQLGGMSLAEADILRRAMGKKDLGEMDRQKQKFTKGAVANGVTEKIATEIFEVINKFANYGFNKSHSVAYSYLAYQTAYLKAHFTAEFMTSNLTNEFGDQTKVGFLLNDCKKLKIEILAPNVNNPSAFFKVVSGKILFGLAAIKNVGALAVESIIKSRAELNRDYTSVFDFCAHSDLRLVNKRALEGLVLAGAFDRMHNNRAQLFESVSMAIEYGQRQKAYAIDNVSSLFGDVEENAVLPEPSLLEAKDWSEKEKLTKEREVLGFYATSHPLNKYELEDKAFTNVDLAEPEGLENRDFVRVCGVITDIKTKLDRNNKTMAFFNVDSLSGTSECMIFSKIYEKCGIYVNSEECVMIVARPESNGDNIKLNIEELMPIDEARRKLTKGLRIIIDPEMTAIDCSKKIAAIFEKHPGNVRVWIEYIKKGEKSRIFRSDYKISAESELLNEIMRLVGEENVSLLLQ